MGRQAASKQRPSPADCTPHRQVADLAEAGGWEAEFDRDVWQMRRLGFDGNQTLVFTSIPQPWLRLLADLDGRSWSATWPTCTPNWPDGNATTTRSTS